MPASPVLAGPDVFRSAASCHADYILRKGLRPAGCADTPLFADGWDAVADAPVVFRRQQAQWGWALPEYFYQSDEWVLSNGASQQNLFRFLAALSAATGEGRWRAAAAASFAHTVEHLQAPCGLFFWGGHYACDLRSGRVVCPQPHHELKCHFPAYELLWELNPDAVRRYLHAAWGAHILNWDTLEMNRHGSYPDPDAPRWEHPWGDPPVFGESNGLSFINAGADLLSAGVALWRLDGDERAWTWTRRLEGRYEKTRDARTGLRGYQYTTYLRGDRAFRQLGARFGERAHEGRILGHEQLRIAYGIVPVQKLLLRRRHGAALDPIVEPALRDLAALGAHALRADGLLQPMFTDGTPIRPEDVPPGGYYNPARFAPLAPGPVFFWAAALAWAQTREPVFWRLVRVFAAGLGLGDFGEGPDGRRSLNANTENAHWMTVQALLDLWEAAGREEFRGLAGRVGSNLLAARFDGRALRSVRGGARVRFDDPGALTLLHLDAALNGRPRPEAPAPSRAQFHAFHEGVGRCYDTQLLYGIGNE